MNIASWNVNSLRVRLPQVIDWLKTAAPDVLVLQETKCQDADFPEEAFREINYIPTFCGQKTYNGVAILSRETPSDLITEIPELDDPSKRLLVGTINGVRVVNVYVPNGASLDSEKYPYKLEWLARFTDFIQAELVRYPELVILGDFNIAPFDIDVHDPDAWAEGVLVSPAEREALTRLFELGLVDTFREFESGPDLFSWWDYRGAAFRRKRGLRIDLVLASTALMAKCTSAGIDIEPRKNDRPSDHTPVFACFDVGE